MKTHFTLWIYLLVLLLPIGVAAQDKLKIKDPGGNVLMEVRPEGVLVRKITTTERLAVAGLTPAENGLIVYDTDTKSLWLWRDTQWIEVDGVDLVDDADSDPTNELDSWLTLPGIPPGFSDGTDDVNDADSDPTNELQNWNTLPGVPAGFADGADNVDDADSDPTNELDTWTTLPGIPAGFADGTDNVNDADSDPTNELDTWSTLPGIPTGFSDGTDDVNDADSDPTNELDTWATLPGIPAGFADGTDNVNDADSDPTNELDTWSTLPGIPAGFSDGTDDVNDADSDPTNELDTWATLPGIPAGFADGTDNVNDADSDPLNEKNNTLTRNGTQLELTDAGGMLSTNIGWAVDAGKVFNTADNVGIGISTPAARLHVLGGAVLISGTTGATPASGAGTRLMWVPSKHAFRAGTVGAAQWDDANIGLRSFVGGGIDNVASGTNSIVAGGNLDSATATGAFVGGGFDNTSSGANAFVAGGFTNKATGQRSFVGAGTSNVATGFNSTVAGGSLDSAIANNSFVGGGFDNTTSGTDAFVGGGVTNKASGNTSFVGGGLQNTAIGYASFISGRENISSGSHSFVGGGYQNLASGFNAMVAGGWMDSATADGAFVAGGFDNTASGIHSAVNGGYANTASGVRSFTGGGILASAIADNSFVGGGYDNTSSGNEAFVGGGYTNKATGQRSFVGAGTNNIAIGFNSIVAGGSLDSATASNSFVGGGFDNTSSGSDAFVGGGVTNTASGGTSFVGGGLSNTASGYASFASGRHNSASASHSYVGGGIDNIASGDNSAVAGGSLGSATANDAFVGGGYDNTASEVSAFVGGGSLNTASGGTSFVGGGYLNTASGYASFVTGRESTASGNHSIAGGTGLLAKSFGETVFGSYNSDYTPTSTIGHINTDRLFVIGKGTGSGARSNAMTILKGGNVGMGTDVPQAGLHVVGNKGLGQHIMLIENTNHEGSGLKIKISGSHPMWVQGDGENPDFFITRPVSAIETIFEDVGGDIRDYLLSDDGFSFSNLDLPSIVSPAGLIDQLGLTDFLAGGLCKGVSNLVDFTNTTLLQPLYLPDLPLELIPPNIPNVPNIPSFTLIPNPVTIDLPGLPAVDFPTGFINSPLSGFNSTIGGVNGTIVNVNNTLEDGYDKILSNLTTLDHKLIPLPQLVMPTSIGPVDCPNPNPWDDIDIAFERLNPLDYNILNPLSNDNHFITFVDAYDNKLGAITGQSIAEFNLDYFKLEKVIEIGSYIIGLFSVDGNIAKNAMKLGKEALSFYKAANKMGVEYSSGHGDYAEWLERADHAETIGFGDIIGIRGGKVSLSTDGAEQVMVVSKAPIVRGNIPDPENELNGNNIAFIGQVPVKVMGPVTTGDYIIANPETPGYGIAVAEKEITPDQLTLAVGRSWDTNASLGFKFVNTIVGMHNSGWAAPVTKLQQRIESNEAAIQMLTARLDNLENSTSVAQVGKRSKL